MATLPFVDILFGPYLPDLGGMPNPDVPGYLVEAINVRPTPSGYRGMPTFTDIANGDAVSSFTGLGDSFFYGAIYVFFVADDGTVESSSNHGDSWVDVTPATGATLDDLGNFFQFGADVVYVCRSRVPVSVTLTGSALATDFADLAGSPPIARCGARVRQHAVLGCLSTNPYAVQWSAIGDHTDWPTPGTADALANEAGLENLPEDLGEVRYIVGGEKFGIVFQEFGLTRMTYVGGDVVYDFDTFWRDIGWGRLKPTPPVTDGTRWYWRNENGVYATDGFSVESISFGRIEDAIFNDFLSDDHADHLGSVSRGASAYDAHRKMALFAGSAASTHQLAYFPLLQQFSWMNHSAFPTRVFNAYSANAASAPSRGRTIYTFNQASAKLQTLSAPGATASAIVQTGYVEIDPGYRVQIQGAHLLGTGTLSGLTLQYKAAQTFDSVDVAQTGFTSLTSATVGMKKTGRASAPFFAFRVTGTISEAYLLRGIRVYYTRAEPTP